MATQVRTMPMPLALQNQSSGNIITQTLKLFIQPRAFFKAMPTNRQWLLAAIVALAIAGFAATTQTQSNTATSSTSGSTSQTSGFNLNLLSQTSTSGTGTTAQTGSTAAAATTTTNGTSNGTTAGTTGTTAATGTSTTTSSTSSDTILMNGLLAASGVLVMWAGETVLLTLVTMLRGYSPQVGRSLQIAVWASLPLALMLALRYAHYATGGTGGSLGLSLLLDNWSGYATLPTYVQRVLEVFMSNLTLFWLWNLLLLYFGARYALGGRRMTVALVLVIWIVASTVIPALVSQPQTRVGPRAGFGTSTQQNGTNRQTGTTGTGTNRQIGTTGTGTTASGTTGAGNTSQFQVPNGGNFPTGGNFGGGNPPSNPGG